MAIVYGITYLRVFHVDLRAREHLTASLGLPTRFGGVGLQSLITSSNKELLGSWAAITSDFITSFRSKGVTVFSQPIDALDVIVEGTDNPSNEQPVITTIPAVTAMLAVSTRAHAFFTDIPLTKMHFATTHVMGERTIEIPGRYAPAEAPSRLYLDIACSPTRSTHTNGI
jgi:hypothetical protein